MVEGHDRGDLCKSPRSHRTSGGQRYGLRTPDISRFLSRIAIFITHNFRWVTYNPSCHHEPPSRRGLSSSWASAATRQELACCHRTCHGVASERGSVTQGGRTSHPLTQQIPQQPVYKRPLPSSSKFLELDPNPTRPPSHPLHNKRMFSVHKESRKSPASSPLVTSCQLRAPNMDSPAIRRPRNAPRGPPHGRQYRFDVYWKYMIP